LFSAALVRIAPGFYEDDRSLDPKFSLNSIKAFERERARDSNPAEFFVRYMKGLLHGDAGHSVVFGQSVATLVGERAPTTIRTVAVGLIVGWGAALVFAVGASLSGSPIVIAAGIAISGSFVSIPSAILATICLLLNLPPSAAIASIIFPRVFAHCYEQLRAASMKPHLQMARARGLPPYRVFVAHVIPVAIMPIAALAGATITLALGASIPVEALADSPGVGQLAWRAALGRDIPVLVTITLLLAGVTLTANLLTDLASARLSHGSA